MGNFTQNGISFQLNADNVTPFTGKYTSSNNYNPVTRLYNNSDAKLSNAGVAVSINGIEIDWNSAQVEEDIFINTTGELLSWIKNSLANKVETSDVYSKDDIDAALGELENSGGNIDPEVLNGYVSLTTYNDLLTRFNALVERVNALDHQGETEPQGPTGETEPVGPTGETEPQGETPTQKFAVATTLPLNGDLTALINEDAEKPEEPVDIDMTSVVSRPTMELIIYPLEWEVQENGEIVKPIVKDPNGFEVGFDINEDTPTIVYNGVTYRVLDIELGKMNYTIEF